MRNEQLIFDQIEISLNLHWAGGGRRRRKIRLKVVAFPTILMKNLALSLWGQGWCSGESTRLPPMWPGFQILASTPYVSVGCVLGSVPCSERFFSGYPGFPLSSETNISNSTRNKVGEEPLSGCATSKSLFMYLFIYSFIYLFF